MPNALKNCPKSNKSPNLVTLVTCVITRRAICDDKGEKNRLVMDKKKRLFTSVTRLPECVFNIWPFTAMKTCPKSIQIVPKWVKNFVKNQINLKYIAKDFEIFATVVEFRQIWSYCFLPSMTLSEIWCFDIWKVREKGLRLEHFESRGWKIGSVTRWLDYLYNIWPFATMNICLKNHKNCLVLNKYSQNCESLLISLRWPNLPNLVTLIIYE